MKAFVDKYDDRIHGVLSCFDRMLFRGYLPIMSGWSMAQLLQAHEIDCTSVKPSLMSNAERVKAHAVALALQHAPQGVHVITHEMLWHASRQSLAQAVPGWFVQ